MLSVSFVLGTVKNWDFAFEVHKFIPGACQKTRPGRISMPNGATVLRRIVEVVITSGDVQNVLGCCSNSLKLFGNFIVRIYIPALLSSSARFG